MRTEDIAREIFIYTVGSETFWSDFTEKVAENPAKTIQAVRGFAGLSFVLADIFVDVAKTRDQAGGCRDAPQADTP